MRIGGIGDDAAVGDRQVGGAVGQRVAHHGGAGQDQAAGEHIVGAHGVDGGGGAEAGQQEGRMRAGQARQHAQQRRPPVRAQLGRLAVAVGQSQRAGLRAGPGHGAAALEQDLGNGRAARVAGHVHAQGAQRAAGQAIQPAVQRRQVQAVERDGGRLARHVGIAGVEPADLQAAVAGVDENDHACGRIEISPTETGVSPASVRSSSRPCASTPRAVPLISTAPLSSTFTGRPANASTSA